jgi:hypothetical protein
LALPVSEEAAVRSTKLSGVLFGAVLLAMCGSGVAMADPVTGETPAGADTSQCYQILPADEDPSGGKDLPGTSTGTEPTGDAAPGADQTPQSTEDTGGGESKTAETPAAAPQNQQSALPADCAQDLRVACGEGQCAFGEQSVADSDGALAGTVARTGTGAAAAAATGQSDETDADKLNCSDFGSQSEAQQTFNADISDPNVLDADGDGVACESLGSAAGTDTSVSSGGSSIVADGLRGVPGELAYTGAGDLIWPLGSGLVALSAGAGMLLITRRRRAS